MSDFLVLFFLMVAGLLTIGLVARVLAALFDEKSLKQIKTHPVWHSIWLASVAIYWSAAFGIPLIQQENYLKAQHAEIRQNVREFVEQAGGWNALRSETDRLSVTTNTLGYAPGSRNPFLWRFASGENPEFTNSFPLISKLNPWRINFRTDTTYGHYVFVEVYFTQWGGGRYCTRYYTLALTPTNRDELPSSLVDPGDKIHKLTNSVYEVTWKL